MCACDKEAFQLNIVIFHLVDEITEILQHRFLGGQNIALKLPNLALF